MPSVIPANAQKTRTHADEMQKRLQNEPTYQSIFDKSLLQAPSAPGHKKDHLLKLVVPKQFDFKSYFKLDQFKLQQTLMKCQQTNQTCIDINKIMGYQSNEGCQGYADPNYSKRVKQIATSNISEV